MPIITQNPKNISSLGGQDYETSPKKQNPDTKIPTVLSRAIKTPQKKTYQATCLL